MHMHVLFWPLWTDFFKFMKISIFFFCIYFLAPKRGVYITVLHCANAEETVQGQGPKMSSFIGPDSSFWAATVRLLALASPRRHCQAAECFAESWAARHGFVGVGSQIDWSF